MLIGVAWFLKLAFDNHWIGPLGRVIIGLLAGAALIVWSERFHHRGFAVFSYSLKAIGSGTLYLSLWAAFQLYALVPAGAAFAAMIAVTAFNGYMAWIQDAELLALYAIAGGLSTPLAGFHGRQSRGHALHLSADARSRGAGAGALRPWSRLLFVSFVGTALFIFGWWSSFYTQDQAARTALFLCCFFLVFCAGAAPHQDRARCPAAVSAMGRARLVRSACRQCGLGFLAFYSLLSPLAVDWAAPWLAVAFAAFYLLLMRLPESGILHARRTCPRGSAPDYGHRLPHHCDSTQDPRAMDDNRLAGGGSGAALVSHAASQSMLLRAFALICHHPRPGRADYRQSARRKPAHLQ